ncbi:MAG: type II toxin-antitoxin system HicB family antitoxin [Clostridia bacterium]|nr:type II toxin-antitoxin system HicB family antitoxin [Clostridia bacterium]
MKVIYPVLFYEEKDGQFSVFVPDLKGTNNICVTTCGTNLEDAMNMAQDLIAGVIVDIMEQNNTIPRATKIEDVSFEKFEKSLDIEDMDYVSKFKTYISVDVSAYVEKWGKELVKKTVNIPKWINTRAEELKINFSKTLEEALLQKIYKK